MKNTVKFSGIIALVAVIGLSFASCGGGSSSVPPQPPVIPGTPNPAFVGTWLGYDDYYMSLTVEASGRFTIRVGTSPSALFNAYMGYVTTSGNTIYIKNIAVNGYLLNDEFGVDLFPNDWVTESYIVNLLPGIINDRLYEGIEDGWLDPEERDEWFEFFEEMYMEDLAYMFGINVGTFTLVGATLTITFAYFDEYDGEYDYEIMEFTRQ